MSLFNNNVYINQKICYGGNKNYNDNKKNKYNIRLFKNINNTNDNNDNVYTHIDYRIRNIILSKLKCFYDVSGIDNVIKLLLTDIAYKKKENKKNDKRNILKKELNNFILETNNKDVFYFNDFNKITDYSKLDNYIYHLETGAYGSVFRMDSSFCIKCIYFPIDDQKHEFLIPLEIVNFLIKNNLSSYISFFNIPHMLIKNFNLNAIDKYFKLHSFILVILRLLIDIKFELTITKLGDAVYRFSDIENNYKYLFKDVDSSQILENYKSVTYLYTKHTNKIENLILFNKFDSFIYMYKQIFKSTEKISNKEKIGSALIMPLAISNAVELRLNENNIPDMDNGTYAYKIDKDYYRYLVIQVLLPILIINNNDFIFAHNDLKPNNILVFNNINPLVINYKNYIFNFDKKYIFKITDFDFTKFNNVPNGKIKNKPYLNLNNIIYDIYYLFYNIVNIFFKVSIQQDKELYAFLMSFLNEYKHEKNSLAIYMGPKKINIIEFETLLFKSKLFDKWIKQ